MKYLSQLGCYLACCALPACGNDAGSTERAVEPVSSPNLESTASKPRPEASQATEAAPVPLPANAAPESGSDSSSEPTGDSESGDMPGKLPSEKTVPVVFEPGAGSCCSAQPNPGCEDSAVQACVCAADPRCCTEQWDPVCAVLVAALGCGECKADCCEVSASAGCIEPEVERCVCDKSPSCCQSPWDEFCVLLVASETAEGACGQCE